VQGCDARRVSLHIPGNLLAPKTHIRSWGTTAWASVTVPKAAVHKHGQSIPDEHDIGPTGQVGIREERKGRKFSH
jgi:hypothetical protein